MKLVIIFAPMATGKMTVAQELAKIVDFKVFHNHHTIDFVLEFFAHGTPSFKKLTKTIRSLITEEAAKAGVNLIQTYVWALNQASDKEEIDHYKQIVESNGGEVYFVELEADLNERLIRNTTENRLKHKKKRSAEETRKTLLEWEEKHQMNTKAGEFFYPERYIKINNTNLAPDVVARMIKEKFGF